METILSPEFWIIMVALVFIIWYKETLVRRSSFATGATAGFFLGINQTVEVMMRERMVQMNDKDGNPISQEELTDLMLTMVSKTVVDELKRGS